MVEWGREVTMVPMLAYVGGYRFYCVCVYVCMYVCMYVCLRLLRVCVYIYMCVCACVCVCEQV